MQKKELNNPEQKLIDKIINVAYGDAGFIDWVFIHFKSVTDKKIKYLLKEYGNTAKAVHQLPQKDFPEIVSERIKTYTGGTNKKDSIFSRISFLIVSFFGNRAIPATFFGVLFLAVISFFVFKEQAPTHKYSKAEIELAQKQLKQSLAIVGRTFQKAERSFSKDVLNDQINKNLNRGYFFVNNILIGG